MYKINRFIENLYNITGKYILKSNSINKKINYDYYTYSILSNEVKEATQELTYIEGYRIYLKQYQSTISFTAISNIEMNAYSMSQDLKDIIDISYNNFLEEDSDMAILNTTDLKDITARFINNNEYRFNFDVRLRFSREVKEKVDSIESAKVTIV